MKINYEKIATYILLIILIFVIYGSCSTNSKLENKIQKYENSINVLNIKIDSLKALKQVEKTKVVYIQKVVKDSIKKIPKLNTIGIANYYEKRYNDKITITKEGIIFTDTIAKINIIELIKSDGCFKELDSYKKLNALNESQINKLDTIIKYKDSIVLQKNIEIKDYKKKAFSWKLATIGVAVISILIMAK